MPMPSPRVLATTRRRIVVGLDGSIKAYGWAILEVLGHRPVVLADGCIETELADDHRYRADRDGERLDTIAAAVLSVLDEALALSSDVVAIIEAPNGTKDAASAKALAHAYGVSRAVCTAKRVARRTVQARAVKVLLTGDPDAQKPFLIRPVFALTGWKSDAPTLAQREARTDAVAVGLTGIEQMGALRSGGGIVLDHPGPLHAPDASGRPPMSAETGSVRASRGLSTDGLGPLVPGGQLSAEQHRGGEGETRGA